jgi:uncharacterized protein (DUF1800 family)
VSKQLIQRLVTSNPSDAYVGLVAAVWANDGAGQRGNLGAVVRAVLLDGEARNAPLNPGTYGKMKEPLLMLTAMWRALGATSPSGAFMFYNPEYNLAQAPLRARTVFNFFRPDYAPQGEIVNSSLCAPEFQILDHATSLRVINQVYLSTFDRVLGDAGAPQNEILVNIAPLTAIAGDVNALINEVDSRLLAGTMSIGMRSILSTHLLATPGNRARALDAIYLTVSSPEFFVQK